MNGTARQFVILGLLMGAGVVATLGCDKKDDPTVALAPSASALAPSVAEGMKGVKFVINPASKSAIDMPAPSSTSRPRPPRPPAASTWT